MAIETKGTSPMWRAHKLLRAMTIQEKAMQLSSGAVGIDRIFRTGPSITNSTEVSYRSGRSG
jgi:hypothetical protein